MIKEEKLLIWKDVSTKWIKQQLIETGHIDPIALLIFEENGKIGHMAIPLSMNILNKIAISEIIKHANIIHDVLGIIFATESYMSTCTKDQINKTRISSKDSGTKDILTIHFESKYNQEIIIYKVIKKNNITTLKELNRIKDEEVQGRFTNFLKFKSKFNINLN